MFSHYKYYDQCFDKLMGNDFQLNMRECWVRMFDTLGALPVPEQHPLPAQGSDATSASPAWSKAQTKRDHKAATNFDEFIDAVFGDGIAKHFMTPYNFKVWAHPAEMMNKEWIGERVAVLDVNRAIKNVVSAPTTSAGARTTSSSSRSSAAPASSTAASAKPLEGHVTLNKTRRLHQHRRRRKSASATARSSSTTCSSPRCRSTSCATT